VTLAAGDRLGPYEITAKLGEGGMGEVWRATDTKLKRDVAIKVLPAAFTEDRERLARFEREAQLLAQLHHPNIASIFGLEESGGTKALVMELVEGPTLAERLEQGALPLDESLSFARQIAEALEAAHEKGIVHRDLKPQNVKTSREGQIKVLDFGLAKAMDPAGASGVGSGSASQLAQSPTLTLGATVQGVILGTAAYMAPEQARGVGVDKRADIWAFGVLLFEMLSGRRLFEGELVTDVLANVLKSEVDFGALPAETPAALRRLLRRCLERQPKRRLHDIADARIVLDELIAGEVEATATSPAGAPPAPAWKRALPWAVTAVALAVAATGWLSGGGTATGPQVESAELALAAPEGGELDVASNSGWGAVSPDGRQVVLPVKMNGERALWVRPIDRAEATRLPGTETGFYPFWSPDGRWVAFFTQGLLMKVEVAGGLPERICEAERGRGGSWGSSGWIVFNPVGGGSISRVRAEGGEPVPVTELDQSAGEDAHYWPTWLPGEKSFVYFIRSGRRENQGVYLGQVVEGGIDRARRRIVATSASGLFSPAMSGRVPMLLWTQEDRLLARALDPVRGALSGPVAEIARGVRVLESQRATMATISGTGTLVFASSAVGNRRFESFDRSGASLGPLRIAPGDLVQPAASPDGTRLAYTRVRGGQGDIWIYDFANGTDRVLSTTAQYEEQPTWSQDGRELLFSGGGDRTFRARVDGESAPREVPTGKEVRWASAWASPDWVIGTLTTPEGELELAALTVSGTPKSEPLGLRSSLPPSYSWDARALAFVSDEAGATQGFVVSVEVGNDGIRLGSDRQRLPVEGAERIRWRQDGRELYASAGNALWAMPVERRGGALHVGVPEKLFEGSFVGSDFAVYQNGERFVASVDPAAAHQSLGVVLNWPARLAEGARQ